MARIKLDQYFTSPDIAEHCFKKTLEIIGEENISEFIESSSGEGIFINQIEKYTPNIPYKAYDIDVRDERVIEQDFLKLEIDYKNGRCIIGNPPFGEHMNLAQKFYKKSILISDYVAFILPISQLNNSQSLYEFDLVYSEDLGFQMYTDRNLHCCFNIFRRNKNGNLNKKVRLKLKDIKIVRQDSKNYNITTDYDLKMCYWGASVGKILKEDEFYSAEYKIIINNKELKNKIIYELNNVDWKKRLKFVAMPKLQQFHIVDYLKEMIPELE